MRSEYNNTPREKFRGVSLFIMCASMAFMNILTFITPSQTDYELLDSGNGEKLERYGEVILSRPDPQAVWSKKLSEKEWSKAGAVFARNKESGNWRLKPDTPKKWSILFGDLQFEIRPTPFKHTGLFPEQLTNWQWMRNLITNALDQNKNREISVLNLFGYTGGATLASAAAGAAVCHVDGSKAAVTWAKENAAASKLADKPIRWIVDDARAFVKREIKRGKKYDGIILDPPSFGRGPKGEVWKIEDDLLPLLKSCMDVLSDKPLFIVINGYAAGYSAIAYHNLLSDVTKFLSGSIEIGELVIQESSQKEVEPRLLSAGITARWLSRR
jgi:23S rRNA (cytosine1962-C5)-methyltransferase